MHDSWSETSDFTLSAAVLVVDGLTMKLSDVSFVRVTSHRSASSNLLNILLLTFPLSLREKPKTHCF